MTRLVTVQYEGSTLAHHVYEPVYAMATIDLNDGQRIIDSFHPGHTVSHVVDLPNSGYT